MYGGCDNGTLEKVALGRGFFKEGRLYGFRLGFGTVERRLDRWEEDVRWGDIPS